MSDIDPTPDTPTTIGDRLGWFRGDMQARLDAILGTPASDLATIANALAPLAQIQQNLDNGEGYSIYNMLDQIYMRLIAIGNAIGAEPNDSLEVASVRGLLNSLIGAMNTAQNGIYPDNLDNALSAYTTNTSGGRRYVVWSVAIAGVTKTNEDRTLTPDVNWDGYEIYVQSAAPSFRQEISLPATEYPTNSWLTLGGSEAITISVDAQYTVRAFMRVPASAGVPFVSLNTYTRTGSGYYYVVWPSTWPATVEPGWDRIQLNLNAQQRVELRKIYAAPPISLYSGGSVPYDGSIYTINGPTSGLTVFRDKNAGSFTIEARLLQ